jgi:hypothetical protein
LKPVLKATDAANVQDGPALPFVTRRLKNFPHKAFRTSCRVQEKVWFVFFPSNLSASVRRSKIEALEIGFGLSD